MMNDGLAAAATSYGEMNQPLPPHGQPGKQQHQTPPQQQQKQALPPGQPGKQQHQKPALPHGQPGKQQQRQPAGTYVIQVQKDKVFRVPQQQKPAPQQRHPGRTYVIRVPKDKVFRVPPPENARLLEHYTRRAKCRSGCSCLRACLYLLLAILCLAVAVGVVYLVYKPRRPAYTVVSLAVSGVGNASAPGAFSPGFDTTLRADNSANGKMGVHYDGAGSRVAVSYEGVSLAQGAWPAFYQAPGNVTVFVAKAKGAGIRFSQSVCGQMAAAERLRSVPFDVDIKVPVRLQLGGVKTWAVPVTVRCAMAVDSLAANAKVVSRSCNVKAPFLFWRS